jgi:hypothetical protein
VKKSGFIIFAVLSIFSFPVHSTAEYYYELTVYEDGERVVDNSVLINSIVCEGGQCEKLVDKNRLLFTKTNTNHTAAKWKELLSPTEFLKELCKQDDVSDNECTRESLYTDAATGKLKLIDFYRDYEAFKQGIINKAEQYAVQLELPKSKHVDLKYAMLETGMGKPVVKDTVEPTHLSIDLKTEEIWKQNNMLLPGAFIAIAAVIVFGSISLTWLKKKRKHN